MRQQRGRHRHNRRALRRSHLGHIAVGVLRFIELKIKFARRLLDLGGVNRGTHDERLPTLIELLANALPHPINPVRMLIQRHRMARDSRPPGGHVLNRRHVKIAEHGHRDRARNRCGREHERVGRLRGFHLQRCSLLDTESVLLVNDDESEVEELGFVAQQGVRAHDDARLT